MPTRAFVSVGVARIRLGKCGGDGRAGTSRACSAQGEPLLLG
ncbi:hypothetical protein J2S58_001210 [Nakamurella flavida]|nr:hypothetical protein [Nakamurella flavida]